MNLRQNLESYTVVQLRNILRSQKLPTKGRKAELIHRLQRLRLQNMAAHTKEGSARQRTISDSNGMHKSKSKGANSEGKKMLELQKEERAQLVLWKKPLMTLHYSFLEWCLLIKDVGLRLWRRKKIVAVFTIVFALSVLLYHMEGSHQSVLRAVEKKGVNWLYWVALGILSSVGLGTGLHTFLLYLGPFIAQVTLAAYECNSVDFPEPPYPVEMICPEERGEGVMSMWTIMSKVRMEAIMWLQGGEAPLTPQRGVAPVPHQGPRRPLDPGLFQRIALQGAGTAIGELPPYFMARAARLSGIDSEDDEFEEIEELIHEKKEHPEELGLMERAKLYVHNLVQKVGFVGILVCASIPNPLFDLAGITCGHFLVPFWTFFGATLIGKAIIKMHLQKLCVIFLFTVHHVEQLIQWIGLIPGVGESIQRPFREWLLKKKQQYHKSSGTEVPEEGGSVLSWVFEKVVLVMVAYFLLSIVNSSAQAYHKRLCRAKRSLEKAGVSNYTKVIKSNKD